MIIKKHKQNIYVRYPIILIKKIFSNKFLLFLFLLALALSIGVGGLYYGTKLKDSSYSSYFSSMYRYFDLSDSVISKFYLGFLSDPERMYINVDHMDMERLLYRVTNAKNRGKITAADKSEQVKAEIIHNNNEYKVKLKLRGTYLDHVRSDKWSFRVKVKNNNTIFGMSKFSLSSPETRNHIHEWIFQKALDREGLISLRYKFVEVFLNGKNLGIYALEEFFDKRLIENNRLREGILIKPDILNSKGGTFVYQKDKVLKSAILTKSVDRLNKLLKMLHSGNINIENVVDIRKSAKYFALSEIFGGQHGHLPSNFVAYFNPITSLLEPIGYDSNVGRKVENYGGLIISSKNAYHDGIFSPKSIITLLFNDKEFNKLYIDNLKKMTDSLYLDGLFSNIDSELTKNLNILYKEYPYFDYFKHDFLESNVKYIHEQLNNKNLLKADFYSNKETNEISIVIDNYGDFPVSIIGLFQGDNLIFKPIKNINISGNLRENERLIRFYTSASGLNTEKIFLKYKIFGSNDVKSVEVVNVPSYFYQLIDSSSSEYLQKLGNLSEFDFFEVNSHLKTISVPSGKYVLEKNVVIPKGYSLYISPGVEIDLLNSSGILSYSKVFFNGSKDNPINIKSTDLTGQGLSVINANNSSVLKFVNFNNLTNFSKNNWSLTGGVNFYMSDVDISHSSFNNSNSEDALNIIKSNFTIKKSIFNNIYSDAFDSDFSNGSIVDTLFSKCGNDGVDLSGSVVNMKGVIFDGIGDKAISVGEGSNLVLKNTIIRSSEIGVTSKDSSSIDIEGISIENTNVGFTAFTKKSEFGPATIKANKILFKNVQMKYLIEKLSEMKINNQIVPTTELTVEDMLYGNIYGRSSK